MLRVSPQRFILYSRTFMIPAVFLLFIAGLLNMKAEYSRSRAIKHISLLAGKVSAQEGIRAVKRLQYTYEYCLESGLWNDLADLFSENAVVKLQAVTVKGKKAIKDHFMAEAGRNSPGLSTGRLNVHLFMQPVINLDKKGKIAFGTWHETALLGKFGISASWRGGVYENEYIYENGVWKILRLNYREQYHGDYDSPGLKAPPAWNIPYHFKAEDVSVTIPPGAPGAFSVDSASIPLNMRISVLAQQVRRLNDETELQNLQHIYGYYMDRRMWDDIVDLFSNKCTFEIGHRGIYKGKTHIRKALETFYGPFPLRRGELFDHIFLATVVTIAPDGKNASVRSRQLCMLGTMGEYAQWEVGTYENSFVRENGTWKIKAIRYFPEMITDYDKGWARNAMPAPAGSREYPPDRWSSRRYKTYPGIYYLAFNYRNPVTERIFQYPAGTVIRTGKAIQSKLPETASIPILNPEDRLDELGRSLDAAIAVDAVENLNSAYGYYIDESDWDSMADIFASNGSKEITGVGVYTGRKRIRKILKLRGPAGGRAPGFYTIHQLVQPVVHISENVRSARARLRLFQYSGTSDGTSGSWIGGIYENTAVFEKGEWKLETQDLMHTFNVSYRDGWARTGGITGFGKKPGQEKPPRHVPGSGITRRPGGAKDPFEFSRGFPPDRPIRAKQYMFPEIAEPAFHYKNPVSGRMPGELLDEK